MLWETLENAGINESCVQTPVAIFNPLQWQKNDLDDNIDLDYKATRTSRSSATCAMFVFYEYLE